jgi:putative oxidoreductase
MLHDYGAGTSSLSSFGPAILRVAVGAIFIAHGAQKLFGVWGGGGLEATAGGFAKLGLEPSYPLAVAAGLVEFGGGLLLVAGALTLFAALALTFQMLVAIWKVHGAHGFFLPAGYEYNVALIAALVSLLLTGPGALSFDRHRAASAAADAAGRARVRHGKI